MSFLVNSSSAASVVALSLWLAPVATAHALPGGDTPVGSAAGAVAGPVDSRPDGSRPDPATVDGAEAPAADAPAMRGFGQEMPAGAPEDQALIREGIQLGVDWPSARARSAALQWQCRHERLDEQLAEAEKGADETRARNATEVRRRLSLAWEKAYAMITVRWPVDPTRVCGYPAMGMQSAMLLPAGTEKDLQLTRERANLLTCVERAREALSATRLSIEELEKVSADAQRLLSQALPTGAPAAPKS